MRYLKRSYSDQLLMNTACVSYESPHLKRLWSSSVDFLIFLLISNFYFPVTQYWYLKNCLDQP